MTGQPVRFSLVLVAFLGGALLVAPAPACPFCGVSGQTLTQEMDQALFVLYGTLKNAHLSNPGGEGFATGETDLELDRDLGIVKGHASINGKKIVTLPKYLPGKGDSKFLIFCDLFRGKIDPYRGLPVSSNSDMPKYLKGALGVQKKKTPERLKYFFDYLQNADLEISNDALKEFGNASYDDVQTMVDSVPVDRIATWLADPNTPGFRVGLYASMLGHAKTKRDEYGKLLRSLVDDPEKRVPSGIDGVLAGQVLLQPKEGYSYLHAVLGNRKHDFNYRYSALKAARFFIDVRKEVVPREQVIATVAQMLEQHDIADLAIEDLRKWKSWQFTRTVLSLRDRPAYDIPIMRRAILRFMIQSDTAEAKKYVKDMREADADLVENLEELLKTESALPPRDPRSPGSN